MDIDIKKNCGVYNIVNLVNGKMYIGSTTTPFHTRFEAHRRQLRKDIHDNPHLQRSWNKHGESNFEFVPIEVCEKDQCFVREQFYLDAQPHKYNILPNAGTVRNYRHTSETKQKISAAFKGAKHPAYSGEYRFYHPTHGYFIGGMFKFAETYGLRENIGHKLKEGILDKSHEWIYINRAEDLPPENISQTYLRRIDNDRSQYHFIHSDGAEFMGSQREFFQKYKLDRSTITKLTKGKRHSAFGWIIKS